MNSFGEKGAGSIFSPGDTSGTASKPIVSSPLSNASVQVCNTLTGDIVDPSPVIEEFQYLLEKSQQMFSGLRDLTPLGSRHWRGYFQKTFEVYTRLWQFQQKHRTMLVDAYGLKRWEIGEIASKIGQLYYHYYLRTSERRYLQESSVFYEAIRDRDYFTDIFNAHNPGLAIKLLRYYARFIVVSLLLNNKSMAWVLLDELTAAIDEYKRLFKTNDITEWQSVIQEIKSFIEAENHLIPKGINEGMASLPNLVSSIRPSVDREESQHLRLQEAILVGHQRNQIKFSELTVDVYRMIQILEQWIPPERHEEARASIINDVNQLNGIMPAVSATGVAPPTPLKNPHKYILFKPTFSQLNTHIATAFQETNVNTALLIFLSADGVSAIAKKPELDLLDYRGGIGTTSRIENWTTEDSPSWSCLHPGDLRSFTRKPLFLVIESDNSIAYRALIPLFGQPLLCLLSPTKYPNKEVNRYGSLYTIFLYSPLLGFALIANIQETAQENWTMALHQLARLEHSVIEALSNNPEFAGPNRRFLQDDFLAQLIARHCICHTLLSHHASFTETVNLPSTHPPLPYNTAIMQVLEQGLYQLVSMFRVEQIFNFVDARC
ncbi:protein SCAI [Syncephalis fuscata]|nr:protein SCAI [Syncephalis fuscata]